MQGKEEVVTENKIVIKFPLNANVGKPTNKSWISEINKHLSRELY